MSAYIGLSQAYVRTHLYCSQATKLYCGYLLNKHSLHNLIYFEMMQSVL